MCGANGVFDLTWLRRNCRIFAALRDDKAFQLYAHGRDFLGEDFWFVLERRKHHEK